MVEVVAANSHYYQAVEALGQIPKLNDGARLVLDGYGKLIPALISCVGGTTLAREITVLLTGLKGAKDFVFSAPKAYLTAKKALRLKFTDKDLLYKISAIAIGVISESARFLENASKLELIDLGKWKFVVTQPGEWLINHGVKFGPFARVVLKLSGISKICLLGKLAVNSYIHVRDCYNGNERYKNMYRIANDVLSVSLILFGFMMPLVVNGTLSIIAATYALRSHARVSLIEKKREKEKQYYIERKKVVRSRNLAMEHVRSITPPTPRRVLDPREDASMSAPQRKRSLSVGGVSEMMTGQPLIALRRSLILLNRELEDIDMALTTLRNYKKLSFKEREVLTAEEQAEREGIEVNVSQLVVAMNKYHIGKNLDIRAVLSAVGGSERTRIIRKWIVELEDREEALDANFGRTWDRQHASTPLRSPSPTASRSYDELLSDRKISLYSLRAAYREMEEMKTHFIKGFG
jgi:hypothetical protein